MENVILASSGTFLETGISHASYTLVIGIRSPVSRASSSEIFIAALNALTPAWRAEVIDLIKLFCNHPRVGYL